MKCYTEFLLLGNLTLHTVFLEWVRGRVNPCFALEEFHIIFLPNLVEWAHLHWYCGTQFVRKLTRADIVPNPIALCWMASIWITTLNWFNLIFLNWFGKILCMSKLPLQCIQFKSMWKCWHKIKEMSFFCSQQFY